MSNERLAQLEQNVANLQNAMLVAMEEVDQLRSQMYLENGKLQRELHETFDAVVVSSHQPKQLHFDSNLSFSGSQKISSASTNAKVMSRIECLEKFVRDLASTQEAQTPTTLEAMATHTKRLIEDVQSQVARAISAIESRAHQIDERMTELSRSVLSTCERKITDLVESGTKPFFERMEEAVQGFQQRESSRFDAMKTAIREVDNRLRSCEETVRDLDKRASFVEENVSQIDAELRESHSVSPIQPSRRNVRASPAKGRNPFNPAVQLHEPNDQALSASLRDEIQRMVEERVPSVSLSFDSRQAQQEIQNIRQDVVRCVSQIERLMDDHQRLVTQHHTCLQAVQRQEQQIEATGHKFELDINTELARLEAAQKAFFARQDQTLATERHQLSLKIGSEVQKLHQRHVEELQRAEHRRLDELRMAQQQPRLATNSLAEIT